MGVLLWNLQGSSFFQGKPRCRERLRGCEEEAHLHTDVLRSSGKLLKCAELDPGMAKDSVARARAGPPETPV